MNDFFLLGQNFDHFNGATTMSMYYTTNALFNGLDQRGNLAIIVGAAVAGAPEWGVVMIGRR
jgi:hypothetical protein